jgi:hypothetical protein
MVNKKEGHLALAVTASVIVAGIVVFIPSEWIYIQRLGHCHKQLPRPIEWHQPQERVSGASVPRMLPDHPLKFIRLQLRGHRTTDVQGEVASLSLSVHCFFARGSDVFAPVALEDLLGSISFVRVI